ncbi:acetate/propionate family kinase [sulfur-oxidizing endosymbiont of Gigantopelta aegis]|uniref:acetate/propionate family kinase n=1 Tax=sulfur-oxidizing endosymbiont of Gigantopelta aegis TaxID=2794934 RepID=UPI0018DB6F0C|nr:acetate kinase [sulfur-oxidizing endosymbiont of Gigantopelta aegis]
MIILVLNSGSSSLKYQLFDMPSKQVITSGLIEHVSDHQQAVKTMEAQLRSGGHIKNLACLAAVGHRVVHGGEQFQQPALIDQTVIDTIEQLSALAPLHNPANLLGIKMLQQCAPDVPQVAVFDTAFHQSLPEKSYLYALPYELYEKHQVRRYGFHGTSHHYVTQQASQYLGESQLKIISLHLGNGASACAVLNGQSIDTSMGLTPLEGLVMGTRSGDIDPAIAFYLAKKTDLNIEALDELLNKKSGLKGICGQSDMRTITDLAEKGDELSELALQIFCYRIKKYIGAYIASLNGLDAIVFTGGIGENASIVRQYCCDDLQYFGIEIDHQKNKLTSKQIREIQSTASTVKILVIPTNEELEIAQQVYALLKNKKCFNKPMH